MLEMLKLMSAFNCLEIESIFYFMIQGIFTFV